MKINLLHAVKEMSLNDPKPGVKYSMHSTVSVFSVGP